ncbi:unnamed protein product [Allacma fusca]|uniref:Peptidase S1 domain-containing protein n=1 Tax=Allacma fusca TaxID=39272 RepID=A0A8J2L1F8_9HEXA|nr:unnamed protein product [Allacma fusca]
MHMDKTTNWWQKKHWGFDGKFQDEKILSTHICTYTAYKNVCHVDSGGSIDEEIDGKWYAVGVVSYGHGCTRLNEAGVYSRVSEYTSWIEQTTGINNFCKT